MYPGRSEEVKQKLTDQFVKDLIEIAGCKETSISVAIEEVAPENWSEQVYKPEILANEAKLYRKPGY